MSGNVMVEICVSFQRADGRYIDLSSSALFHHASLLLFRLLTDDISFHSFFLMRTPNTVRAKSLLLQIRQQNSIRVGCRQSGERNVVPGGDGAGLLGRLHGG